VSEQPKQRGGTRAGAGRKPKGRIKRDISLPPQLWEEIEEFRKEYHFKSTGEAIELLINNGFVRQWQVAEMYEKPEGGA
jgi:hypothetical protein